MTVATQLSQAALDVPKGRAGLFDPSRRHWGQYWGGDLRGVIEKADDRRPWG
jgi:hypothetical protein